MKRLAVVLLALLSCSSHRIAVAGSPPLEPSTVVAAQLKPGTFVYENTVDLGDIDEENLLRAGIRLTQLIQGGERFVTIRIDSFGGSIFQGMRWGRQMEDLKKAYGVEVTCIVDGSAYSMGAVLLESPLCDRRLATLRSTILFHNGSSGARGTVEDMKQALDFLEALNEMMAWFVSNRLGVTVQDYRFRIDGHDWAMAAPEALTANVIDGFASPSDIAPPAMP